MNKEPDKKKRPDRAAKLKARKELKETIVKSCLLKCLVGSLEQKNKIIKEIKNRVKAYSERVHLASLSLSEIVKTKFVDSNNVDNVDVKSLFDITFIRQLLLGTDGVSKIYDDIVNLWNSDSPLAKHLQISEIKRYTGDRNIYSSGAQIYLTNLKNSLRVPLEQRIKTFLKCYQSVFNLSKDEKVFMLYKIFGWKLPKDVDEVKKQWILQCIEKHRSLLGLSDDEQLNKDYLRKSDTIEYILKYYVYLNRFYSLYKLKTFNIVPICRIKAHYITIDSSVLFGILKDADIISQSTSSTSFQSLAMDHWKSILNVVNLKGSNSEFTKTINTDGICICVHFQKPRIVSTTKNNNIKFTNQDRVVAVDPGRVNIFYGVEQLEKNKIKEHVLTRKQYYNDSGINIANHKIKQWTKTIKDSLIILSKVTTKGMSVKKHHIYIETYLNVKDSLWEEYMKPRWSRQRFRLHCGKKRVFARFFNSIDRFDTTREVKLAYGSAKFNPSGKGELSVPTTRVFKECVYHFSSKNIKLVDEFLTTKIHCETNTVLEKVNLKGAKDSLRGLLWCNSPTVSKFVSRDRNAALNILRCAILPQRPESLERKNERTKVVIGKYIKDCSRSPVVAQRRG